MNFKNSTGSHLRKDCDLGNMLCPWLLSVPTCFLEQEHITWSLYISVQGPTMQANSLLIHLKKQYFIPKINKLFLKGPESKYFMFCRIVCTATIQPSLCSSKAAIENEWACLCSKNWFIKSGVGSWVCSS